jgi:hypothetical protein
VKIRSAWDLRWWAGIPKDIAAILRHSKPDKAAINYVPEEDDRT